MDRLSQIRKHARDCRERAARTEFAEERDLLHELASHWDAIADIHERLARPRHERS